MLYKYNVYYTSHLTITAPQVRRCGQASQEAALLTQHKDVWVENLKRLQTGAWSLGRELELLLATLCRDIANSDSAKQSLGDMLQQINRSEEYQLNLRWSIKKM